MKLVIHSKLKELKTNLKTLEYVLPIQDECKELNESHGTDFKSTDWHIDDLYEKINDLIQTCGDEGGWYVYDAIKVTVTVEYEPEDK